MDVYGDLTSRKKRDRIEALTAKVGGVYKLSALLQKRVRELVKERSMRLVSIRSDNPLDIAMAEVERGLIGLELDGEPVVTEATLVRRLDEDE